MPKKSGEKSSALDYSSVPKEHDGRPYYTPPEGWKPEIHPPAPDVEGATKVDYEAEIRR